MCSTQRCSTSSRKIEKAFLGRSEGSESFENPNTKAGNVFNLFSPLFVADITIRPFRLQKAQYAHPVAPLKGMTCLLQQVDNQLWGQKGLPMGVNHGAQGKVGALSDPFLQLLDTVERHR